MTLLPIPALVSLMHGDFFGKKQSGVPEFRVADMIHDYRALETARNLTRLF